MTITYSPLVFTSKGFGTFLKLLFNWKASIYKLVWRELMVYMALYTGKPFCLRTYIILRKLGCRVLVV